MSLRGWLGQPDLDFELELDGEPALTKRRGKIHATLPLAWFWRVWGRNLSTIWGRFCLDANTDDGRRWTLSTIDPDLARAEPMVIELPRA